MGGSGTVDVSIDGKHTQTIAVGGVPKLYTLFHATRLTTGTGKFITIGPTDVPLCRSVFVIGGHGRECSLVELRQK
jgi:hypothetical protein